MRDEDTFEDEGPSKSQRKRDMTALQALGERLLEAPPAVLDKLALPERLLAALAEYKRLPNKREAKRRQLQFIGKLMRDVDSAAVEQALEAAAQGSEAERRRLHRLESLRDELLADAPGVHERLLSQAPGLDLQHLRQLVRQARQEETRGLPPTARRKLFRYLRDTLPED